MTRPYNPRFDKTGYLKPPKGKPMFTTETPPDPTDADIPKNLISARDRDGKPYLLEAGMAQEAAASVALDGETQSFDTPVVPARDVHAGKLGKGEGRASLAEVINREFADGHPFISGDVINGMTTFQRQVWINTYGVSRLNRKVGAYLNEMYTRSPFPIQKLHAGKSNDQTATYKYLGPDGVKEVTAVPTGSTRKKRGGFTLKLGEQTHTVVRLVRENAKIGDRINTRLVYSWFTEDEKARWRRAYGDRKEVLAKLRHAISNVKYSRKYLLLEPVDGSNGTWKLKSKEGHFGKAEVPAKVKVTPKVKGTPKVEPKPEQVLAGSPSLVGLRLVGHDLDGNSLYLNDAGVVGTLRWFPI